MAASKTTKKSTKPKKSSAAQAEPPLKPPAPIRREVIGAVFLLLGAFCVLSIFNTDGVFIAYFSELLKGLLGRGFWICAPSFLLVGFILLFHRGRPVTFRVISALLLPILFAAMANLFDYKLNPAAFDLRAVTNELFELGQTLISGGVIGGLLALGLEKAFSFYAALPLLLILTVAFTMKSLSVSFSGIAEKVKNRAQYDPSMYAETAPAPEPKPGKQAKQSAAPPKAEPIVTAKPFTIDVPLGEDDDAIFPLSDRSRQSTADYAEDKPNAKATPKLRRKAGKNEQPSPEKDEEPLKPITVSNLISDPPKPGKKAVKAAVEAEAKAVAAEVSRAADAGDYEYPPIDLLSGAIGGTADCRDEILVNKERLEGAIRSFGINASIVGVTRGPTVTRYDIELEQGVKLARVTNLAGDLALALGVVNVRIAPIPDKISTVGIEVPNKIVSTVMLRDILESQRFITSKSKLSFALGKDISGECIVGNIAKLPHMLIAGTTGSGKSVCMNSLIISLLYKAKPDEVKFIMIDPKMVELGVYNGIPHLYVPVVTDPKKAAGALQWSVVEMLKRYRLFSEVGVRDLDSYNNSIAERGESPLPRVVIVIDELADLMMAASKEVEESICRVAQMGRAAGMHLVIATQRPSADVITGLMKANIPSRIAFAVSSAMESRIILDQSGAEKLIGMGDMLYSPVGCGKPTRIQGAYVSDEEREEVIQFIKESSESSQQNDEIEEYMNKAAKDGENAKAEKEDDFVSDYDELLPQAVEAVLEMKSCSVSLLQRRVKLGYARAARIVDQMEELGIVGPYEGAKPRGVLIDRAGWHELQVSLGMIPDEILKEADEMNSGYADD